MGEGVRAGAGGRPGGPGGLRQRPHRARPSLLGSRLAIYLGAVWASIIDFIVTALMLLSVRVFVTMLALAVVGTIVMLVW